MNCTIQPTGLARGVARSSAANTSGRERKVGTCGRERREGRCRRERKEGGSGGGAGREEGAREGARDCMAAWSSPGVQMSGEEHRVRGSGVVR